MKTEHIQKALIYCCALVPLFFAAAWIYTFGFTNYRAHLAYIGLPLGVAMLVLAIGMFLLNRVAIIHGSWPHAPEQDLTYFENSQGQR